MTRYAYFDTTKPAPYPVIGWFDTDIVQYESLPPASHLLAISDTTLWANRQNTPMFVANGTLTTHPPTPPLSTVQGTQIATLRNACAAQITGGYLSNALGSPHTYPSTPTDQANMQASVVASLLPGLPDDWTTPFWCADSTGSWVMQPHTAGQIQQAGSDAKLMIVAAQMKLAALSAAVMTSPDAANVICIIW